MLSIFDKRDEAGKTELNGVCTYLTKPVRVARLRDALQTALDPAPRSLAVEATESEVTVAANRSGAERESDIVLVVEDNLVNQRVFSAMLASIGLRSELAANGVDALEALGRNRYAAIFMDCQLPVMDGYETTRQLRRREGAHRHTCVIAVTASGTADDRDHCLEAGMDDYLIKPVTVEALAAKLVHWQVEIER